jgi:hypothetical protein
MLFFCRWNRLNFSTPELEFVIIYASQESIPPAYLTWQTGTSNRGCRSGPPGWEAIPGLLKKFPNQALTVSTGKASIRCIFFCWRWNVVWSQNLRQQKSSVFSIILLPCVLPKEKGRLVGHTGFCNEGKWGLNEYISRGSLFRWFVGSSCWYKRFLYCLG